MLIPHTTQLNDPTTSLDGLNCTCACGATGVKWFYRNVKPTPDPEFQWPPTGGIVRNHTREPDGDLDRTGGTNLPQVRDAIESGWDVPMTVVTGADFDMGWELARDTRNLLVIQIQYSVLHDTRWDASGTFMGAHAVVIANATPTYCDLSDPLADGRRGLPNGVQRIPHDLVREACGKLVVNPITGQRRGMGLMNYGLVRQPEYEQVDPANSGDVLFNIGPTTTHRDVVLRGGTVLYRDGALTIRQSGVSSITRLGFLGSTSTAHVVVNAGYSNYVRKEDVIRIEVNDRSYE